MFSYDKSNSKPGFDDWRNEGDGKSLKIFSVLKCAFVQDVEELGIVSI